MALRFAAVLTPENIHSRSQTAISASVLRSKIPIYQLALSDTQRSALDQLYKLEPVKVVDVAFNDSNQADAHRFLELHKINLVSRNALGTKWSTQWSNNNQKENFKHVLLQCHCGYDHRLRNSTKRRMPYAYTGCLAHVEIITERETDRIRRIQGILEHNSECQKAPLIRIPLMPLHPSVFEIALEQLRNGATLTEVQERNRQMVETCQYGDQTNKLGQFRYLLRKYDSHSLYRQFYQAQGINLRQPPHLNIHEWLKPISPSYNPVLAQAIFHYSPRTEKQNRLEVCIATDEMKEAAWRYGHRQQILLDGTFGVCDCRLLLFIVMGVDERNHGVPLTFLLFSAPAGNKSTSSGYDTSILIKLLSQWREAVSSYSQREFKPAVAITDTDFKERGALLDVFPDIRLLICRFHLRQSWTNHRTNLRCRNLPGGSMVQDRLLTLENQLINSTDYTIALDTVQQEIAALNQLVANRSYAVAAGKGLVHVQYLSSYWMTHALWQSWSEFGRLTAAAVIGIPLEAVIPTTNHLESFNGILKHKHLKRWSRGGRRVRVDTLVNILATKIAPSIFQQRRLEEEERVMLRKALEGVPGASQLLKDTQQRPIGTPIAFLEPDARRDGDATHILGLNRLNPPIVQQTGIQLTCRSLNTSNMAIYAIWLGYDSTASCSCADFRQRGGACKHIRAAIVRVRALRDSAVSNGLNEPIVYAPSIELPANRASAMRLRAHASRYVLLGREGAANTSGYEEGREGQSSARTAVARAAHYVNEVLQGGFLGDLADVDDTGALDSEDEEALDVGSDVVEEESDDASLSSGDEIDEPIDASARGLSEQLIARTTYTIKKKMKLIPEMHAALDLIHYRDLEGSVHREEYEKYTDELELLTTRMRGLLRRAGPSAPSTQPQAVQPLSQHNTSTTPIAASPERRQYRKDSYSFH